MSGANLIEADLRSFSALEDEPWIEASTAPVMAPTKPWFQCS